MGRGGGRSSGGSSHSSSRGMTSGRSGGSSRSSSSSMRSAGGFSHRSSGSSSTHRGGAGFGGPGRRTSSSSGGGFGSSRPRSGGFGGGYGRPTPPPPRPHYGGGWRRGPVFVGPIYSSGGASSASGCGGCLTTLIVLAIVMAIISFMMPAACSMSSVRPSSSSSTSSQITQVSHTHKKLSASDCDESDAWLDDRADWLDNERIVTKALRYFYDKTGSQPYLVVATDIDGKTDFTDEEGEEWTRKIYEQQFNDDGHTVVAFVEYEESEYAYYIYAGRAAQSVIDDEAREIIADEINYWYTDSSLDDSEYFAKVFTESADTIMFDYEQTTKTTQSRRRTMTIALVGVGAAAIIGMIAINASRRKREEYEAARKLAETPVGTTTASSQTPPPPTVTTTATSIPQPVDTEPSTTISELEAFEQKYGTDESDET